MLNRLIVWLSEFETRSELEVWDQRAKSRTRKPLTAMERDERDNRLVYVRTGPVGKPDECGQYTRIGNYSPWDGRPPFIGPLDSHVRLEAAGLSVGYMSRAASFFSPLDRPGRLTEYSPASDGR